MIQYRVHVVAPHQHTIAVEVTFTPLADAAPVISIPAWTPGSYLIREFSRYIGEVSATNAEGNPVAVAKLAKGTWTAATKGTVTFAFEVYGHELTPRTPHIDGSHAFFLGSNVLPFVHGRASEPCKLSVKAPPDWEVFCPLPQDQGAFVAENYDVLADAAVETGPHRAVSFDVLGVPHRAIFWGDASVEIDMDRLVSDMRRIVVGNAALFDDALPYDNYDFLFHITPSLRGGLEHLNGTTLLTPWKYFETEQGYGEMMTLITHEHFHVWNGKRIRPQALGPFNYLEENYTRALWVVEGLTSYYDELLCVRTEVISRETYLKWFGEALTRLDAVNGRHVQPLTEASYDAWIRLYRPDENTSNRTVSYYLKGAIVCAMADLRIREETKGQSSLDAFVTELWEEFKADGRGYEEHNLLSRLVRATGADIFDELRTWIYGTTDPDYAACLASHGLELTRDTAEGASLGLSLSGLKIQSVTSDGACARAAIYPGDTLVAVNNRQLKRDTVAAQLKALKPGTPVTLHLFRREELVTARVTPRPAGPGPYRITPMASPSPAQAALLDAWLPEKR